MGKFKWGSHSFHPRFCATGNDWREDSAGGDKHGSDCAIFRCILFSAEFHRSDAANGYACDDQYAECATSRNKGKLWSRVVHASSFDGGGEQSSKCIGD